MNKLHASMMAILLAFVSTGTVRAESPMDEENFSATLTLVSDYQVRGISYSGEDPAIQGSFNWSHDNLFAGAWGSSIEADAFELELNFYAGYASTFQGIDWYVQSTYLYFHQAGDSAGPEVDWSELKFGVSRTLAMGPVEPTASLLFDWSPDYTGGAESAYYIYSNIAFALPGGVGLSGGFGYQDVDGENGDRGPVKSFSYQYWDLGISKSLAGFDFDLRYHDTTDDDVDDDLALSGLLPGCDPNNSCDTANSSSRVIFSISRSF